MNGRDAETQARSRSRSVRSSSSTSGRSGPQQYYSQVEPLVAPDLIIVGGGISKRHDEFLPLITTRAVMCPAKMFNNAGIVGAAILAVNDGKPR